MNKTRIQNMGFSFFKVVFCGGKKHKKMNYKPYNNPKYTIEYCVHEFVFSKKTVLRKTTFNIYSQRLRIFLNWCDTKGLRFIHVNKLTFEHAEDFKNYLYTVKETVGKTALEYRNLLKQVWTILYKKKIVEDNPFTYLDIKKNAPAKPDKWNAEQLEKMKSYFKYNKDMQIAIHLCFYCFLRPKEIAMLKIENINFLNGTITVPAYISKNKRTQTITMPKHVLNLFVDFGLNTRSKNDYVVLFKGAKKEVLSLDSRKNMLGATFREFRKKFSLPDNLKFYGLKHTGNYMSYKAGADIVNMKKQNRHHSIEQTYSYMRHLLEAEENEDFKNMRAMF